jgi:hypothetical protein
MGCNMSVVYDWTGRGMISGEVFAVSWKVILKPTKCLSVCLKIILPTSSYTTAFRLILICISLHYELVTLENTKHVPVEDTGKIQSGTVTGTWGKLTEWEIYSVRLCEHSSVSAFIIRCSSEINNDSLNGKEENCLCLRDDMFNITLLLYVETLGRRWLNVSEAEWNPIECRGKR